MKLSDNGLKFISSFEGYHTALPDGKCKAYWDKLGKVWTIGYGCTEGVSEGMVLTKKQADALFYKELEKHMGYVDALCKEFDFKPNQNQFDALVSHCYNCGPRGTRVVFKRNFDFSSYGLRSRDGSRPRGLARRRQSEQALFETPTTKEIISKSRQLKAGARLQRFLEWSGVGSLLTIATLQDIQNFLTDPRTFAVLVVGFAAWWTIKYVNFRTIEAHKEGRYQLRETA